MDEFFKEALAYFKSGGILMLPLFILALYLYYIAFVLFFKLLGFYFECKNSKSIKQNLGSLLEEKNLSSVDEVKTQFDIFYKEILSSVARSLSMIKILATVAPLLGLLGTVSGMAFAMSKIGTNDVLDGISSALITTQCGLSIALPALVLAMICAMIKQKILINLSRCKSDLILNGVGK